MMKNKAGLGSMSNSNDSVFSKTLDRRDVMKACLAGLGMAGSTMLPSVAKASPIAMPDSGAYHIAFRNIHTGESFAGTYRVGSKYIPDAFAQINKVMRDFRTGEEFPVDPQLMDVLYMIQTKADRYEPFEILSAYRSPKTNNMLRRTSSGVAKYSLHMTGQALDIRWPGYSTYGLRKHAVSLKAGGVGYYRKSHFVHLDTGRVRQW